MMEFFFSWRKDELGAPTTGLVDAEYLIALASDSPLPQASSSFLKHSLEQSDYARALRAWREEGRLYIRQLENTARELKAEKRRIAVEKTEVEKECAQLKEELDKIWRSRSWRLTAPLRFAAGKIRPWLGHKNIVAPQQIVTSGVIAPQIPESRALSPLQADLTWVPDVRILEKPLCLQQKAPQSSVPIGVFIHIYYLDLAKEILSYLSFLPEHSWFYVSTDTQKKCDAILELFTKAGFASRTEVRLFANRGWDLAPFFVGFSDQISRYPLILRIHSKSSSHMPKDFGDAWRRMLFTALCGSRERVNGIIQAFEGDPCLGMVSPPILEHYADSVCSGKNFPLMRELLEDYGIRILPTTPIDFPMGSMFWCRPEVLSPWMDKCFCHIDFAPTMENERDGSLAHALERLFFFGCGLTGYSWARVQALAIE